MLLADSMAHLLSANAARHLRAAQVTRFGAREGAGESARATLLQRGFPAPESLVRLEALAGNAVFPGERTLGVSRFLDAHPAMRSTDLPRLDGECLVPVFGDPAHVAEWEAPFLLMGAAGSLSVFDAPLGPVPIYASLEHFLEMEALAPLSPALHVPRIDALCGEMLGGLVGAVAHPPAEGAHATGFVGDVAWVKELRTGLEGPTGWSPFHGTFLLSEQLDVIVDAIALLREEGFSLGHRGPHASPPPNARRVLSFTDAHPNLGHRANVEVTVWGERGAYVVSRTH